MVKILSFLSLPVHDAFFPGRIFTISSDDPVSKKIRVVTS